MIDNSPARAALTLDFDLLGPTGDVVAARRLSKAILSKSGQGAEHVSLAKLVLTATYLQMAASTRVEPSAKRLHDLLSQLAKGDRIGFETSPMQFIQYVACEIEELDAKALHTALDLALKGAAAHIR